MVISVLCYLSAYLFGFIILLAAMLIVEESSKHISLSPREARFLLIFWCMSTMLSVLLPWWISLVIVPKVTWLVVLLCLLTGIFQGTMVGPWMGPTLLKWSGYSDQ